MISILNLSKQELIDIFIANKIPKFRAEQVYTWIYQFGKRSFFDMTNIGKNLQTQLANMFYIYRPKIKNISHSIDGTTKFLLELIDQNNIEIVFIPEFNLTTDINLITNNKKWKRATICISSQVGCSVGCLFCNTGKSGFIRNLSTEEIVSQLLIIKDYFNLWQNEDRISNIVFMGMGEPLYNYSAVLKAIDNMVVEHNISRRKITISTAGISNILMKIAQDINCKLAISLHAPNDNIRSKIMPINNIFNIESIMTACKKYSFYHKYMKITFEYLLLNNINNSLQCAKELVQLLLPLNAKVNLIYFNPWPECNFLPSSVEQTQQFAKILSDGNLDTTIRKKRGEDIMAACGQLSFLHKIPTF